MNDLFKQVDRTAEFNAADAQSGKGMGVLSYLAILSLIPYFSEKNNQWVRFHAVQGLNLFISVAAVNTAISILSTIFGLFSYVGAIGVTLLSIISHVVSIGIFVLEIMGIVNVCNGKAIELPVIKAIQIIKK